MRSWNNCWRTIWLKYHMKINHRLRRLLVQRWVSFFSLSCVFLILTNTDHDSAEHWEIVVCFPSPPQSSRQLNCHSVTIQLITINITLQIVCIFSSIPLTDFDATFVPVSTWKKNRVLFSWQLFWWNNMQHRELSCANFPEVAAWDSAWGENWVPFWWLIIHCYFWGFWLGLDSLDFFLCPHCHTVFITGKHVLLFSLQSAAFCNGWIDFFNAKIRCVLRIALQKSGNY